MTVVLAVQVTLLCLLTTLVAGAVALVIRAKKHSLKFLQGPPSSSWLLGLEWETNRIRVSGGFEESWFKQYGTAFRFPTCFGADALMVSDPRALQHIYHKSAYRYTKAKDGIANSRKLFGPGLSVVVDEEHRQQRKILNPAFSAPQTRPFAETFRAVGQSLVSKWIEEVELGNGSAILDTTRWLPNMTLDALGESMFNYDFGAMDGKKDSELTEIIRHLFIDTVAADKFRVLRLASYRFLPDWTIKLINLRKTKEDRRFAHWLSTSTKVAEELLERRAEEGAVGEKANSLMDVLTRAINSDDPLKRLEPIQALSQLATIIFAGHETSASTLTWSLYQLARHPGYQKRIFEEIKSVREVSGNTTDPLTTKDLENLIHLNSAIRETLRVNPIVPDLLREAAVDDVIPLDSPVIGTDGSLVTEIPVVKGQRVITSLLHYNKSTTVWGEDADDWNPDRFQDNQTPTMLGMYGNLMSFGGGVRGCIGWRFAILEIQVVLAALVETFIFTLPKDLEIEQVRTGPLSVSMLKDKWYEGSKMPLEVTLRRA